MCSSDQLSGIFPPLNWTIWIYFRIMEILSLTRGAEAVTFRGTSGQLSSLAIKNLQKWTGEEKPPRNSAKDGERMKPKHVWYLRAVFRIAFIIQWMFSGLSASGRVYKIFIPCFADRVFLQVLFSCNYSHVFIYLILCHCTPPLYSCGIMYGPQTLQKAHKWKKLHVGKTSAKK